ncbi:hypothetical protein ACNHUS_33690 [Actinomycetes bacterium M1A6_2h]
MGGRIVAPAWSLALAVVAVGPLLGNGYLLLRDAVSTPRSYFTDTALGLSDAAPRAVPQDAAIALLSSVVDGGIVVKVLLVAALWAAGWGAAVMVRRVLPGLATSGEIVAVTVAVWNPYVAERLLQGHWSLLIGYGALPWTVVAAVELRAGRRPVGYSRQSGRRPVGYSRQSGRWWPLALCMGSAGITPTGVLLVAVLALTVLVAPGGTRRARRVLGTLALTVVASAPWLVATALGGSGSAGSDPAGVAAFAARAEPGLATVGSLAGLGGIWNSAAVPTSRTTAFAAVGTALLLLVAAAGASYLWRRRRNPVLTSVVVLGAMAVVVIALAATPWGHSVGEWAAHAVPGAGLTRDGQKWVALWMPALALAAAAGTRRFGRPRIHAAVAAAALLVALPDLVGAVSPITYPASWDTVAQRIDDAHGDVAVLPTGTFRRFEWSGTAPVLDPAPRLLAADVVATGDLPVAGGVVRGEGTRATAVESVLLAGGTPDRLAELGVGWVLVERGTPGALGDSSRTLEGLEPVFSDADLALYSVPDAAVVRASTRDRVITVGAHLLWAAVVLGASAVGVGSYVVRRKRGTDEP